MHFWSPSLLTCHHLTGLETRTFLTKISPPLLLSPLRCSSKDYLCWQTFVILPWGMLLFNFKALRYLVVSSFCCRNVKLCSYYTMPSMWTLVLRTIDLCYAVRNVVGYVPAPAPLQKDGWACLHSICCLQYLDGCDAFKQQFSSLPEWLERHKSKT